MYSDDIKLFVKNEKRTGRFITRSYNIKSRHRDGVWQRKICHASNEKRQTTPDGRNGTTKSRQDLIACRKGNIHILGHLRDWNHQKVEMKERIKKKSKESKKAAWDQPMLQKPFQRNKYLCSKPRFSGPFLKLTWELKQMDQRTRKLMTMNKTLHPRDDVDRKDGGRVHACIEDSVDASIKLEDYIENTKGYWFQSPETILITCGPTEWQ